MNPSKILAFLHQQSLSRKEINLQFGTDVGTVLDDLREEGSISLEDQLYRVNETAFTSNVLSWQCGVPVEYIASCSSTNDIAEQRARVGWTGVVVTDFQTKGRGRLGRVWDSSAGENLLFSMVMRPTVDIAQASRCTLVWAAEIADELGVFVKWPNDIIDGKDNKIGGLLSSMHIRESAVDYIIFGIGLNVNQQSFANLPNATSLRLLRGDPCDRNHIFCRVIKRVYASSPTQDFSLWRRLSRTLGRRVKIGDVEGIATTIREDGALIVDGIPVLTGDVQLMEGEDSAFGHGCWK